MDNEERMKEYGRRITVLEAVMFGHSAELAELILKADEHSRTLTAIGEVLTGIVRTQAQHGEMLTEILRRLP